MTEQQYKVYPFRWWILVMFSCLVMANALLWVTFAPISDITQHYFHSCSFCNTSTGVNFLANIFLILYLPGTILSVYLTRFAKPQKALFVAAVLTCIGALIRTIATSIENSLDDQSKYALILLGQSFGALAQPILLNYPPAIASIWFPVNERDIATTIGAMSSPIGNAIGQILPIIFVSENKINDDVTDDNNALFSVKGMNNLMITELILCTIPLFAVYFLFEDAPPTPPSHSTLLKLDHDRHISRDVNHSIEAPSELISSNMDTSFNATLSLKSYDSRDNQAKKDSNINEAEIIKKDFIKLMKNKDFLILFFIFSIGVGFFNSILTLLNQIISPFGYSNDDAGTFGAVFIVFGLIGAGIAGYIMEKTKAYRTVLRVGLFLCLLASIFLVLMLFSNNFIPLLIAFAVMGLLVLPLLPIMMENCAECTYPVAEELSMGILFTGSNILGLGFIFALQYLLDLSSFGPPPLLPSNFFIIAIILVGLLALSFYHGKYHRLEHEAIESTLNDVEPNTTYSPPPLRPSDNDVHIARIGSQDNSIQNTSIAQSSSNIWNASSQSRFSFGSVANRLTFQMPSKLQVLVTAANTEDNQ